MKTITVTYTMQTSKPKPKPKPKKSEPKLVVLKDQPPNLESKPKQSKPKPSKPKLTEAKPSKPKTSDENGQKKTRPEKSKTPKPTSQPKLKTQKSVRFETSAPVNPPLKQVSKQNVPTVSEPQPKLRRAQSRPKLQAICVSTPTIPTSRPMAPTPVVPWRSTANLVQPQPNPLIPPIQKKVLPMKSMPRMRIPDFSPQDLAMDDMEDRMSVLISAIDDESDGEDTALGTLPIGNTSRGLFSSSSQNLPSVETARGLLTSPYISKVWSYSNSRLPQQLPPFTVYAATYPLICSAARYSQTVYSSFGSNISANPMTRTTVYVPQNIRLGTKAMSLAMAPITSSSTPTLVLAIRGSANFADWAINFRPAPASPKDFLDDEGNLVHSGFLAVARSMAWHIAEQLQQFLATQTNNALWREKGQILLTGHSAGGAVASLLYCHILSQSDDVQSPLKDMRVHFKRVHCIIFGTPPTSLLPLQRPQLLNPNVEAQRRWKKNLFFSFINEGDPVVRADRAFIRSLINLYSTSTPRVTANGQAPLWKVPPNTFSSAGKLVVLRTAQPVTKRRKLFGSSKEEIDAEQSIEAVVTTDDELRKVIYGDPGVHSMRLYRSRVETLAVKAVTGY